MCCCHRAALKRTTCVAARPGLNAAIPPYQVVSRGEYDPGATSAQKKGPWKVSPANALTDTSSTRLGRSLSAVGAVRPFRQAVTGCAALPTTLTRSQPQSGILLLLLLLPTAPAAAADFREPPEDAPARPAGSSNLLAAAAAEEYAAASGYRPLELLPTGTPQASSGSQSPHTSGPVL